MAEAMKMIVEDDADVNMTLSDFYSISAARKREKILQYPLHLLGYTCTLNGTILHSIQFVSAYIKAIF